MIRQVDAVFDSFPNLIHIAGHDHGLQFIKDKQFRWSVAPEPNRPMQEKVKILFSLKQHQGFVTADLLINRTMRFTYYEYRESGSHPGI